MYVIERNGCKKEKCLRFNSPGPCVIPWAFNEHFSFFAEI